MATTEDLTNALAFAAAESNEGDLRVVLSQAKVACRTLATEIERLQAIVARIPRYENGPPALALDIAYQRVGEGQIIEVGPIQPVVSGLFSTCEAAQAEEGE